MKRIHLRIICALMLYYCNSLAQIPTDSLVAYYPFNGNANDSSGNGFNGILNGQTSVAGICAGAFSFSGNYINCGDPGGNQFDLVNSATISLWLKLNNSLSQYAIVIGKDAGGGSNRKWFLAVTSNELVFHVNDEGNGRYWIYKTVSPFALNSFYHIVVTKEGNTYTFYLSGVNAGIETLPKNILDVPAPLKIGDLNDGGVMLNAVIDEVRIYHKALSQAEINQLHTYCPGGPITASGTITQNQQDDLKIYPNPSQGKFLLNFSNLLSGIKNVSVYNVLGKKIFNQQTQTYNQNVTIDLEDQPRGVYVLQLQTRKKIIVRKIIVE